MTNQTPASELSMSPSNPAARLRRAVLAAVALLALSASARAEELTLSAPDLLASLAKGRLISGSGPAGFRLAGGPSEGLLLGVDIGAALPISTNGGSSQANVALGARVGYQLHSGLSLALQYQDLGVSPTLIDGTQWQILALGARYEFPFLFPMPYVEVAFGLSFVDAAAPTVAGQGMLTVGPGAGVGLGVALPLGHHVAIDVGARDWLAPVNGALLQVVSVQAGVEVTFGTGAL